MYFNYISLDEIQKCISIPRAADATHPGQQTSSSHYKIIPSIKIANPRLILNCVYIKYRVRTTG